MFVYVGTYTQPPMGDAEGILVASFDDASGALTPVQTVREVANASFLAVGPGGRFVCAVRETDEGEVGAFARDDGTGELNALNRQSSHGSGPCYVSFDPSGRFVLVANYGSGTLAVLPIAADGHLEPATSVVQHDGSTGQNTERQDGPHAHMIAPSPDGSFVLATDLGLDQIIVYRFDTNTGKLTRNDAEGGVALARPGAGPRHFAFAPDGRTVYVINELDSTLTTYAWDAQRGTLTERQSVAALPDDFHGENTCAQVVVAPDGRFVYGSNRGHDSIAIWSVDEQSGALTPVGHVPTGGQTPRNFALDPTGTWLLAANQASGTVVTFRRDAASGSLSPTGAVLDIPSPVCIVFSARGGSGLRAAR
ncbi:MAG: lactonase family protein [Chloroflexia bacterium]|nr:lactonase family protein [Chloroflexia bacterium]